MLSGSHTFWLACRSMTSNLWSGMMSCWNEKRMKKERKKRTWTRSPPLSRGICLCTLFPYGLTAFVSPPSKAETKITIRRPGSVDSTSRSKDHQTLENHCTQSTLTTGRSPVVHSSELASPLASFRGSTQSLSDPRSGSERRSISFYSFTLTHLLPIRFDWFYLLVIWITSFPQIYSFLRTTVYQKLHRHDGELSKDWKDRWGYVVKLWLCIDT